MIDPAALETRCSTAMAARYLGCTRRHVEKLIAAGALDVWDVSLPGAKRARFSVLLASVRVLLIARHRKPSLSERITHAADVERSR